MLNFRDVITFPMGFPGLPEISAGCTTWMSQEISKWLVNGLFHLLKDGVYWGYNPLTNHISTPKPPTNTPTTHRQATRHVRVHQVHEGIALGGTLGVWGLPVESWRDLPSYIGIKIIPSYIWVI